MEKENNIALKITAGIFAAVSLFFVIYATITMRGLYLDGSYFMLRMLSNLSQHNYSDILLNFSEPYVRFCIMFLLNLPVVFADVVLCIENKNILMMIYSCGQFIMPLLILWWNYSLTKRTKRTDILFLSLFNYSAVLLLFSIFSITETLIGSGFHFVLWNYLAGKIDYNKKDIILILFLLIMMFATWEYVILLGPVFFAASVMYANREENVKNKRVKQLIGVGALAASIFTAVYLVHKLLNATDNGFNFIRELYDYLPKVFSLCSLFSCLAVIFLIAAFFNKNKLSKSFLFFAVSVFFCALVRLCNTFNFSLLPMWEMHMRSIVLWMMPCIFFSLYIFDLLKKECNPIKINNYITIVLICGIFQTIWQCINTYFWDVNVKYMKKELDSVNSALYIPSEHNEISSFFNSDLRRYIWHGNYAAMSILLSDTYKIKTLAVNYDMPAETGNKTFRESLYYIPEDNMISIPFGVKIPVKTKFWDVEECAIAFDNYDKKLKENPKPQEKKKLKIKKKTRVKKKTNRH